MDIESIPIIAMLDADDIGIELDVEPPMDIPDMVLVGDMDIDIDILSILVGRYCGTKS